MAKVTFNEAINEVRGALDSPKEGQMKLCG